jgi:phosphoribosylanthranilate isomerase
VTRVKICGITNLDDALVAIDAGADVLGFNFYDKSPRYIAPSAAKDIISKLPPDITKVGVFVNSSLADVERIISSVPLGVIQLHGNEDADFVRRLITVTGSRVIKAFRVSAAFEPTIALDYEVDHFMLDTDSRTFGGSGEAFDWEAAVRFKELYPTFYLAGGLTPENVCDAIRKVRPFAVDVCSGVESSKGKKDRSKVMAFVRNAKGSL